MFLDNDDKFIIYSVLLKVYININIIIIIIISLWSSDEN